MNLRNHAIAAGITAALVFGTCLPTALAVPAGALEQASQQLETYGAELATLQGDLDAKTADLEMTAYRIGEKQAQITQTEEQLTVAKGILSDRMRSSYKLGPISLLQVFMDAESLDDVVSRVYYMDKVASHDAKAIADVRDLEGRLKTEKGELEGIHAEEQKAVDELQAQVDDYTIKLEEARAYYDSLDAQIKQEVAAQQAAAQNANIAVAINTVTEGQEEAPAQTTDAAANNEGTAGETETTSETSNDSGSSSGSISRASGGGGLGSAYSAIGSPYVYGGDGPSEFDCSGLVCFCYGYSRGRTTYDLIDSLQSDGNWKSSMSELSAGDLVFTDYGHVGIYIGDGMMIHAPRPGRSVCTQEVWSCIGGGTF